MTAEMTGRITGTLRPPVKSHGRDDDTQGPLDTLGHRDVSVLADVVQTGEFAAGDKTGHT